MHKNKFLLPIIGALLLMTSLGANATLINGVTASSSTGNIGINITNIANAVNGVGLASLDLLSNHAPTLSHNSYVTDQGAPIFTFDLGGLFNVAGFSFWNQNSGGPHLQRLA